jgi:hypothetical protein
MSTTRRSSGLADQPTLMPVQAVFPFLNLGRTKGYELLTRGEFPVPVLTVGKRRKVRRVDLVRFLGLDEQA